MPETKSKSLSPPPAPSPRSSSTAPNPDDPRNREVEILRRAFTAFTDVTEQLQKSYDTLQERLQAMDLELARKNEALERNLREKEEVKNYLDFILQSLTNGVIVVDRQDRVTTFNQRAGVLCGLEPEACLGRPLQDLFREPGLASLVEQSLERDAENLTLEEEILNARGERLRIQVTASPARDNLGRRIGTLLVLQDVTPIRRLEEDAKRNDRLRAMGEMAAGIAHEIRNPMGGIELFASLLKKDLADQPEQARLADHIISGVRNLDRIISSLLLFARSPEPSRQKCPINDLLRDLMNDAALIQVPPEIRVRWNLCPEGARVAGDQELLTQVFLNSIRNAIQAMPGGGELTLSTRQSETPEADSAERRFITVTVEDTGSGIPPETLQQIFNPFFTTRDKGTGLGLAIAHNIIKAHQGTIEVNSTPGRGSRFIFKIPAWEES